MNVHYSKVHLIFCNFDANVVVLVGTRLTAAPTVSNDIGRLIVEIAAERLTKINRRFNYTYHLIVNCTGVPTDFVFIYPSLFLK